MYYMVVFLLINSQISKKGVYDMKIFNKQTLMSAVLATTLAATSANADGLEIRPYVGLDLGLVHVDYGSDALDLGGGSILPVDYSEVYGNNFLNAGLHAGLRFGKYFALEASYFQSVEKSKNWLGLDSEVSLSGFNVDSYGYAPLDDRNKFSLIGSLGVGFWEAESQLNGAGLSFKDSERDTFLRVGAGFGISFTDNLEGRAMLRYNDVSIGNAVDGAVSSTISLSYKF